MPPPSTSSRFTPTLILFQLGFCLYNTFFSYYSWTLTFHPEMVEVSEDGFVLLFSKRVRTMLPQLLTDIPAAVAVHACVCHLSHFTTLPNAIQRSTIQNEYNTRQCIAMQNPLKVIA